MKLTHFALALVVASILGCGGGGNTSSFYEGPELSYGDPGEMVLRNELLRFPWKHEEWYYKFQEKEFTRVTLGLEHLYLETNDNRVVAVDRFNGRTVWEYHIETGRPLDWKPVEAAGVPAAIQDLETKLGVNKRAIDDVIASEGPGDKSTALQKERRQFREQLKAEQMGDNIYFISQHILYCLDRRTGNRRWRKRLGFAPSARPFAIRDFVFVAAADLSRVWVLSVEKLGDDLKWFRSSISGTGNNHIMNQPVYSDPSLFYVSHDSHIYRAVVSTGEKKSIYQTERSIKANPITYRYSEWFNDPNDSTKKREHKYNFLFVGGTDNTFYCLDADAGALWWKYECGAQILSAAIAKDKTVYIKTVDGALHALNVNPQHMKSGLPTGPVRKGELRWKLPLGERFLIKGRNHVYILGPNRRIYRMDEMTGKITGRFQIEHFDLLVTNTLDDWMYLVHPSGYIFAVRESDRKY